MIQLEQLERDGVEYANQSNYEAALSSFTKAIDICPTYASAYNNRAQLHRILGNGELAMSDLNEAIDHGEPYPSTLMQVLKI